MSVTISFDDALDAAIDAITRGEHVGDVLARYPRHAGALRPLLEVATASRRNARQSMAPVSQRLADNFSNVSAALQRARMASVPLSSRLAPDGHWWQQKLTFASLSLPAGAFALLAFVGISGAAAASLAVTGDAGITNRVQDAARAVTPDWVPLAGPERSKTAPEPAPGSPGAGAGATEDTGAPAGGAPAGPAGSDAGSDSQAAPNAPHAVTMSGVIGDVHGNVFTLTNGEGEFKVNIDGRTTVAGTIVDGATALVAGDVTAEKNLHATSVEVTSAPEAPIAPDGPGSSDKTPGPPDGHTPGPPPDHTPGPPADHTPPGHGGAPPGQSTASPPGQGNGNSNGGGKKKP